MSPSPHRLWVVMYHYVRDLPRTRFPRIKGMLTSDFNVQVDTLSERYEMATLESALAFLSGEYRPERDLCLLTFDDGLKEHYTDVMPILVERGIEGLFFIITRCPEEGRVVPVHKNHFLMAELPFDEYRQAFIKRLAELSPETSTELDQAAATKSYRWDTSEVAAFKYLLNMRLPEPLREKVLDSLFMEYLGDEAEFSRQLYMSWDEAREMQARGQVMGGHSDSHASLATLDNDTQRADLEKCAQIVRSRLAPQPIWPFSYPYGKSDAFNATTVETIRDLGFACGCTTIVGPNEQGQDPFCLKRIDTKDVQA
ncbi:MAG: polysaccharide deacetylase family protein [Chloroflexia bacterium]